MDRTPTHFAAWRLQLKLSPIQAAQVLGVPVETVDRWEGSTFGGPSLNVRRVMNTLAGGDPLVPWPSEGVLDGEGLALVAARTIYFRRPETACLSVVTRKQIAPTAVVDRLAYFYEVVDRESTLLAVQVLVEPTADPLQKLQIGVPPASVAAVQISWEYFESLLAEGVEARWLS